MFLQTDQFNVISVENLQIESHSNGIRCDQNVKTRFGVIELGRLDRSILCREGTVNNCNFPFQFFSFSVAVSLKFNRVL